MKVRAWKAIIVFLLFVGFLAMLIWVMRNQVPVGPKPEPTHYNVFMMHFEPTSATEQGFQRFAERVAFVKKNNQKFSLGFTPQWVGMILSDPRKTEFVRKLFAEGWDMAPQHHGPHHDWSWDGFCDAGGVQCMNLRFSCYRINQDPDMQAWYRDKERYVGDMGDYMDLMNRLYRFKVLAMGPDRYFDWPDGIAYSLDNAEFHSDSGQFGFNDCIHLKVEGTSGITKWEKKNFSSKSVREAGMRFLADFEALERAKEDYQTLNQKSNKNEFLAVVIHIEDSEKIFRDWIEFLHSKDPEGKYNKTITEIAEEL